jgi:serine/threonine-protein kinase
MVENIYVEISSTNTMRGLGRRKPAIQQRRIPRRNIDDLFMIGETLSGNYKIRRVLGSGGMGLVYEAHDRALNRTVAIKAAWPELGTGDLEREAQAMAALRGRGLPAIFSMGTHRDIRFYVMERMYGATLEEYQVQRRSAPVSLAEAREILIGIAEVLATVHGVGLIHCDLKPANIMLAPNNRTVLLDFGICRTETVATEQPLSCGSPRYIAPEIIRADVSPGQAHLVDIYALGVMAFELLVGYPPFYECPIVELLQRHLYEEPVPVRSLRPDVPPALAQLIADMMAKEPLQRPFSADAVARTLRKM